MSLSNSDATPGLLQQKELIKEIATALVRASGDGWDELQYVIFALGSNREESLSAIARGVRERLRVPREARQAVTKLRDVMATPGAGAWFSATIHVDRSLRYDGKFDYNAKPAWDIEPGSSEYVREQRLHPRTPENQPAWFKEALANASA